MRGRRLRAPRRNGRLGQKTLRGRCPTQKQVYFEPQTLIAVALAVEKNLALVRWSIQRQVVNAFDLPPPFWVHRLGLRPCILDRTPVVDHSTRIVTLGAQRPTPRSASFEDESRRSP